MPIAFVTGDLFINRFKAQALAHGCNCQGSMGAGIATSFRDRYPEMYAEYRRRCKATPREFNLGDAWLWKDAGKPQVFNLGTQEGVWRARASYEAIEAALKSMREQAGREGITSIAIPRIGVAGYAACARGGLSMKIVVESRRRRAAGLSRSPLPHLPPRVPVGAGGGMAGGSWVTFPTMPKAGSSSGPEPVRPVEAMSPAGKGRSSSRLVAGSPD